MKASPERAPLERPVRELALLFLWLGATDFFDLATTNFIPGLNSTEMALAGLLIGQG